MGPSTPTQSRMRSITPCGSCERRYLGSRSDGHRTSTWVREKGDDEGVHEERHDEGGRERYTGLTNRNLHANSFMAVNTTLSFL
jgi:hypothetical protein